MNLTHMWAVAAYCAYVSAFLSALGAGEVFCWEKRGGTGRAEEDGVCFTNVFFE